MKTLELPEEIRLPKEEIDAFVDRVEGALGPGDRAIAQAHVDAVRDLREALEHKGVSIDRLRQMLFGSSTETLDRVLPEAQDPEKKPPERKPKPKRKGHGRNGAASYPGAKHVHLSHPTLRPGDPCPSCKHGKVYDTRRPGKDVRFRAQPPVEATVFTSQTLRCSCCGEVFRPELPKEAGTKKFDETVPSIISLLKYGSGMPFFRLATLQKALGAPLPAGTQWEIVAEAAEKCKAVRDELIRRAAQGEIVHNDDTTMRILELEKMIREARERKEAPERTGVYTTGIVSKAQGHEIVLFFTGLRHAGENLEDVLKHREPNREPPIQMSDGLSRNLPGDLKTVVANCLTHGRRHFVEVAGSFPQEVRHVLTELAKVYRLDARVKRWKLSDQNRLRAHQKYSKPVMDELKEWLEARISEKHVERNSILGDAIVYVTKRWEAMTVFLREPGAPLDNTIVERALKMAILNRKNAYYYRTQRGAEVGDIFMTLIHSARARGVNPFEYLTALQRNHERVRKDPGAWLPWSYQERLARPDTS